MNELNNIERSLNQIMKPDFLEPISKYMSFTFLYGNHMDVTQASLALFDAEPGEYFILLILCPSFTCLLVSTDKCMPTRNDHI